jgi:RND family efflux transporter MFP subunit
MAVSKRSQLDARIAQAAQGVESASVMRSYSEIRAPFAGVVTEKRVEQGQMATPGTPLLTIERAGAYRLEAPVQESMLGSIRTGQKVSVVLDAVNEPVSAQVTEIVPVVDPSSRAFLVKATLPPSQIIRSGLFGRMRVQRGAQQTLSVPAEAIVHRGSMQSVFTADNATARMRMITAGESRNGQVQILSGLDAGDRVIHPRPAGLSDGARIEVKQ